MHQPDKRSHWTRAVWTGLILFTLAVAPVRTSAAPVSQAISIGSVPPLIFVAEYVEGGANHRVLPPEPALDFQRSTAQTATIQVNYLGTWNPDAQNAFEYAVNIWEANLSSPVTIQIDAYWKNLTEEYGNPYVLGSAGATDYMQDFPGAVESKTWYPIALANKLAGSDLKPTVSDLEASFNSHFSYGNESGWYFGTDGKPPFNKWDFVSVVLHEIGHGLGFSGSMVIKGGNGSWGWGYVSDPVIYDRFVTNGNGDKLTESFSNNSTGLAAQLTSDDLFFSGSKATAANGGVSPKLYAPKGQWKPGSSYSHLDDNTFPAESGNALMTPSLSNNEAIHIPGPIALGVFRDIGWSEDVIYTHFTYFPNLLLNFGNTQ